MVSGEWGRQETGARRDRRSLAVPSTPPLDDARDKFGTGVTRIQAYGIPARRGRLEVGWALLHSRSSDSRQKNCGGAKRTVAV